VGAVCWGIWAEEFGVDATELTNVYASNLAGLALGCVFFIPFALKFGRRPVYLASVVVSFAATIWQAKANNLSDLIGSAVVGGLAGAASEALVQMTVCICSCALEWFLFNELSGGRRVFCASTRNSQRNIPLLCYYGGKSSLDFELDLPANNEPRPILAQ
jgi:MFS family permease